MNSKGTTNKPETDQCADKITDMIKRWAKEYDLIAVERSYGSVCFKKEVAKPVPAEAPKDIKNKSQASSRSASEKAGPKKISTEMLKMLPKSQRQESRQKSEKRKKGDLIDRVNYQLIYMKAFLEALREMERNIKADAKGSCIQRLESLGKANPEDDRQNSQNAKEEDEINRLNYDIACVTCLIEGEKARKKMFKAESKLADERKKEQNKRLKADRKLKANLFQILVYLKNRDPIFKKQIAKKDETVRTMREKVNLVSNSKRQESLQKSERHKKEDEKWWP